MRRSKSIFLVLLLLIVFYDANLIFSKNIKNNSKYLEGEFWSQQALKEIIPFWNHTLDDKNGGYFTDVDRKGVINPNGSKYPRMVSRLIYGFCTAYLLSGDNQYLQLAKHGLDYMKKYGWDQEYGGWYGELNVNNIPSAGKKNLFDQSYGNLGPIFYYYVTGDTEALALVEKTHRLMKDKAWDKEFKGYYEEVNRDWSVSQTEKSFNAEIDTATAYLIYEYLATKKPDLLKDLKDIADVAMEHMYDQKTGYFRERFSRKWNYITNYLGPDQIDIGHNLKTVWVMFRIYDLTGEAKYYAFAKSLATKLLATGWDNQYSGWFFCKNVNTPASTYYEKSKCWWTQTEGNFMLLNLYHITRDKSHLEIYQKNAGFWDTYFVDHQYKEVYSYTFQDGTKNDTSKGNLYKSAYHSMENALMNYLYLQLYVHKKTAELNFSLSAASEGTKHYLKIVENPAVMIQKAEINGAPWQQFNAEEGYIILPKGNNMKVKVVLGVK